MDISQNGLQTIAFFEGFRANPYQDSNGIWTIGYGTTFLKDGSRVDSNTSSITEAEAIDLLHYGCQTVVSLINNNVSTSLSQNQFDALCSLGYNIGSGNLLKSSVLKVLSGASAMNIDDAWKLWCHPASLMRRRNLELELFHKE